MYQIPFSSVKRKILIEPHRPSTPDKPMLNRIEEVQSTW
jgi:hypothetical protein